MSRYEATFEVDSRADAEAVRLLVERAYDALREEIRDVYGEDAPPVGTLEAFEAIRDATRRSAPGTLRVRYDQRDGGFER
ncbi:hypothetical protein [Halomarina litorea]|uniref:hypothetical protein n=1 Tax=Halomarina litorea TaxID=2961595 RepID=UPI0020C48533|nr:hypothetical protein [Halomarina sp. BCD28]